MGTKSPEVLAIEKVSEQVEKFAKDLGAKVDKAEIDNLRKAIEDIKAIVEALANGSSTSNSEKELEMLMEKSNLQIERLGLQVAEMQRDVDNTKKNPHMGNPQARKEFTAEVKKFVEDTFDKDMPTRKSHVKSQITIKAAEVFGIPNFFQGADGTVRDALTGRFVDPELYQRRRKTNLILDWFTITSINVPKLLFLVKEEVSGDDASSTDTGSADWIVSGAQKPMRSFRVTTGEVEAKKVAIFGTIEDKLLRDVPSLETWVREDFFDEMREAYNDALLNNNPEINEDAPLGLKHNAVQYEGSPAFTASVPDPNEIDVIIAAAADMSLRREQADIVFISKDIWYKLQSLKDNQDRYQNSPLVYTNAMGQMYIAGVQVVGVDQEDVPSENFLMLGAEVGFKIRNYQDLVFERGLNGTDFREDKTSYRGFQEVLSYIPTHRENSVMYDTFANVLADITEGS